MTSPESQPASISDTIHGRYVEVTVIEPSKFADYLDDPEDPDKILHQDDINQSLPSPFHDADISIVHDSHITRITGNLNFPPAAIHPNELASWQSIISQKLIDQLNLNDYTIRTLAHESYAFYALINEEYAAHIQLSANMHECSITLSLECTNDLEFALNEVITSPLIEESPSSYDLFKQFLQVWTHTIDVVAATYGMNEKDAPSPCITFKAPDDSLAPALADTSSMIESSIPEAERATRPDQSFAMLGGLEEAKNRLRVVAETFNDPEGTALYGLGASHFMLYGPPGTGKTSLVEALEAEINGASLQRIASNEIMGTLVGQSGINLAAIFTHAFSTSTPHIMYFDEFDAIAGKNSNDSVSNIEVKKLLNQYIIEATKHHPNIIIAAATNLDPYQIEDSLIRSGRLEPISVPLPSGQERIEIWSAVLMRSIANFRDTSELEITETGELVTSSRFMPYDNSINPVELAQYTEGMTGADFEQILTLARRSCYQRYRQTGERHVVTQALLLQIVTQFYQR